MKFVHIQSDRVKTINQDEDISRYSNDIKERINCKFRKGI